MLKGDIIQQLYLSKEVNDAIKKMEPVDLQDDLKAEMFAALCELPEERIITMYQAGWIKFYMVRMMLNMVKSNRSGFHKKHRKELPIIEQTEDSEGDYCLADLEELYKHLHPQERLFIEAFIASEFNITKISRESNINLESGVSRDTLHRMINNIKNKSQQIDIYGEVEPVPLKKTESAAVSRSTIHKMINNVRRRVSCNLKKSQKMQITVYKEIVINTTQDMNPEEICDMLEFYDNQIQRAIGRISNDNAFPSFIEKIYPAKIEKVRQ